MTTDANNQSGAGNTVREAFAALPLDEKVSTMIGMEMDLLGDVAKTVVSSASKLADDLAQAFNDLCAPAAEPTPPGGEPTPNA
jgi:hypothetical protein